MSDYRKYLTRTGDLDWTEIEHARRNPPKPKPVEPVTIQPPAVDGVTAAVQILRLMSGQGRRSRDMRERRTVLDALIEAFVESAKRSAEQKAGLRGPRPGG